MNPTRFEHQERFNESHEDVRVILSAAPERPELKDFVDVFEKEELEQDGQILATVMRHILENTEHLTSDERSQINEGKLRSEALEILIVQQAELENWLGENVLVSRTTEYDDVINHIDAVVEFDLGTDSPERIALAIDASMRTDFHLTTAKLARNIKSILGEERATEVKYFQSQVDNYKGSLTNIIPVVIGLEGKNCNQLFADFAQIIKLKKDKERTEPQKSTLHALNEKMKDNPAQIAFLLEIRRQLKFYENLLSKKTNEKSLAPEQLEKLIAIVDSVLADKRDIKLGDLEGDAVLRTITDNTRLS